ncbi:MAG: hypothetical protein AAF591_23860 [Verrucomicrobiota bacterium]
MRSVFEKTMGVWKTLRLVGLVAATAGWAGEAFGQKAADFPVESPHFAALKAAEPYLENEDFELREEFWGGELSGAKGKAIRLQFFAGNTYRVILAAPLVAMKVGGQLHVALVDPSGRKIARASSKKGEGAVVLKLNAKKSGLYMVLMSIEPPKGVAEEASMPCVMYYGYE